MPACRCLPAFIAALVIALSCPIAARADVPKKDLIKVPIAEIPAGAKRALVVGITDYKKARGLGLSTKDAKAFAAMLKGRMGFSERSVTLMTDDAPDGDDRPTYTNMRARIRDLEQSVTGDSVVVVFFSGHGVHDHDQDWLVPSDGDPDDVEGTCISATHLYNQMQATQPRRALLFFDACRSIVKGSEVRGADFGLTTKALADPELAVVYSCRPRQVSIEGQGEIQEGVFTHFVLKGLQGDPEAANPQGVVTFDSLMAYVRGSVSEYVNRRFGIDQDPIGYTTAGSMVLARAGKSAPVAHEVDAQALAEKAYELALRNRFSEAAATARQAIAARPNGALAHAVLSVVRTLLGDLSEGESEARLALRYDPDSAVAHGAQGLVYTKRKQDAAAEREFKRAIATDPENPEVHNNLGVLYFGMNRRDEAAREVLKGFELMSARGIENPIVHVNVGIAYLQKGRPDDAEAHFHKALEIEPNNVLAHQWLGTYQSMRGRAFDAEREFRAALEIDPNLAEAHGLLGGVYRVQRRYFDAEKEFRRALELDDKLALIHQGLAGLLTDEGRIPEAIEHLNRVMELDPKNDAASEALGHLYLRQMDATHAEQAYRRAVEINPQVATHHYFLGVLYYRLRRYGDSVDQLREAQRLNPNDSVIRLALQLAERAKGGE